MEGKEREETEKKGRKGKEVWKKIRGWTGRKESERERGENESKVMKVKVMECKGNGAIEK